MMKSSRGGAWILSVGMVVLGGCKSDVDEPVADPLDDPWVDAIETGDDQPAVVAAPEPLAIVEAGPLPEAQPATAVISSAPAVSSKSAKTAPAAPEQPAAETPAANQQPVEPAPTPVVEPAATPSAEPAQPASPPPITSADFHGSYRYSGGNTQRDEVAAAIEATVQQLARALHGIARKRLTQANPVDSTVDIVVAGDQITTTFESGFTVSCAIDGASVNTTGIDGEKLAVRVRSKDSKLVQIMQGKDGARTVVYVLSADRKKLTVHHKITADRLPEPLTYRLTYSRK
jgi:hypothetical protein